MIELAETNEYDLDWWTLSEYMNRIWIDDYYLNTSIQNEIRFKNLWILSEHTNTIWIDEYCLDTWIQFESMNIAWAHEYKIKYGLKPREYCLKKWI